MNSNKKAVKSGIWYIFATFLVKGAGLITTPIFTRLLTKSEFGLYNNFTSWLAIASIMVTLNLEATLISARYDYEKEFDSYLISMTALSTMSAIIWSVVLNVFAPFFESFLGIDIFNINVMIIYLAFLPAVNLYLARERYYFEYKKSVFVSVIVSIGTALVSVALVLCMQNKLEGRIIGSSLPTVIIGITIIILFARKGLKLKIEYWKYALPICLPFIPHLLSLTVLSSVDRIMITKMCGPEDNALYSLSYTCATMITMLLSALNSAFAPWLGEKLHFKQYSQIRRVSKKYMLGFMGLSVGIILIAPEIIAILGGNSYADGVGVLPPVAAGCMIQFLYCLFVNVEQFEKKTLWMAVASVSAALLNYFLNSIFIPKYGYIAAAYTTFAGYLWLLFAHMIIVYVYGYKDVYSYKFIFALVFVCTVIMPLTTFVYQLPAVRYCLVVIYIAVMCYVIYKFRNVIFDLLKRDKT